MSVPLYQYGPNLAANSKPTVYAYTQLLAYFDICGGLMYPAPSPRTKCGVLEQTHGIRLRAKFCLNWFIMSPSGGEKSGILAFFRRRHFVVSLVGGSLRKLNTGAQLQTFPHPTVSKSFLYSNAFTETSGAQSLTFESVADKQKTDKQPKNSTVLASSRRVKSEPHQTWHVIEDLEHILPPQKLLGVRPIVSPLGGAENFGEPDPST